MKNLWTLRPTALGWLHYAEQSRPALLQAYDGDNQAAAQVTIPTRPAGALRIAQWNIQAKLSDAVVKEVSRHDPDVVIFHEWGTEPPCLRGEPRVTRFVDAMRERGYRTHHVAQTSYPTAVWTRLEKKDDLVLDVGVQGRVVSVQEIRLDEERGAVVLRLQLPRPATTVSAHTPPTAPHPYVWIYATHLTHAEFWTGHRYSEMCRLLQHVAAHVRPEDGLVVAGDSISNGLSTIYQRNGNKFAQARHFVGKKKQNRRTVLTHS
jgi:hypothetical protein